VQRDHADHVGRSGVAVLHGMVKVPEPARSSPPVPELLLAEHVHIRSLVFATLLNIVGVSDVTNPRM
jgi:hypothetical protein